MAAARAVDQFRAKLVFQIVEVAASGRLRNANRVGRRADQNPPGASVISVYLHGPTLGIEESNFCEWVAPAFRITEESIDGTIWHAPFGNSPGGKSPRATQFSGFAAIRAAFASSQAFALYSLRRQRKHACRE